LTLIKCAEFQAAELRKLADKMFLKLITLIRNGAYRLLVSEDGLWIFGRLVIGVLLFFTVYSWVGVYRILQHGQKVSPTTQPSVLFQRRYLPIGG
jgi:hypothetical protein